MKVILTITREQKSAIWVDVPGVDYPSAAVCLRYAKYTPQIAAIAATLDDCDWDDSGWEETVKVVGISSEEFSQWKELAEPDGTVTL